MAVEETASESSPPDLFEGRIADLVREVEGLTAVMEQRAVIEQAKGIIMHTMRCDAEAAFAVLVAQSKRENRTLRAVAQALVEAQDQRD